MNRLVLVSVQYHFSFMSCLAMFLIMATHRSKRESFAIPLLFKLLSVLCNSLIEIPERMAHQITWRTQKLSRSEYGQIENPGWSSCRERDNLTPWTERRHGPSMPYSLNYASLWCALTERDTNLSTIVIECVPIATWTKPV